MTPSTLSSARDVIREIEVTPHPGGVATPVNQKRRVSISFRHGPARSTPSPLRVREPDRRALRASPTAGRTIRAAAIIILLSLGPSLSKGPRGNTHLRDAQLFPGNNTERTRRANSGTPTFHTPFYIALEEDPDRSGVRSYPLEQKTKDTEIDVHLATLVTDTSSAGSNLGGYTSCTHESKYHL